MRNFSGKPLWLWKDPRTCLLLPLWKEIISELGIALKVVFVVRNPLDVARSLEKRNGFSIDKGLGVWFNYTISALKDATGLDTVFMSYDRFLRFLDNWETELKSCVAGLGIAWPTDDAVLKAKMSSFVRHDLRHSASGLDELQQEGAPQPVILLHRYLLELVSGDRTPGVTDGMIETLTREFQDYARFFDYDMSALAECRARLEGVIISPDNFPEMIELQQELQVRTLWAWRLDGELKSAREEIDSLHDSMSWKITKPLRVVHGFLRILRNVQ
jgi:hypothetical protein